MGLRGLNDLAVFSSCRNDADNIKLNEIAKAEGLLKNGLVRRQKCLMTNDGVYIFNLRSVSHMQRMIMRKLGVYGI